LSPETFGSAEVNKALRTEVVEVDNRFGEEYAGRYVFQEITWAKRSRIIQKHTKYHPLTGNVLSSDLVAIQAETIWASLKEQPENKPITLAKLIDEENGIPIGLGELFSRVVNRLCGVTPTEAKNSYGRCGGESLIQASQPLDYAKSSGGHLCSLLSNQPKPSKSSSSS
jgi:hypothetical protein